MRKLLFFALIATLLTACRGRGSDTTKETTAIAGTTSVVEIINPTINVYIENSGSMDGYVNGSTEFKGAIRDMLVLLKYHYGEKNTKIFFINDKVYSTASGIDLANFAQNINTLWYVGNRKDSKLNNVFKQVLERTDNQTVSILFSDYIYSISGRNTVGLLNDEKSLTKDAFLSKWKNDKVPLATTIVKMKSKFNGKYFPYTGDHNNFQINMERPYYICVIGNQDMLNDFNKNIALKAGKIEGFENKYVLSSENPKNIYWSVLNSSFNEGRFKIDRKSSTASYTHGIKDVKLIRGVTNFTFAVAVDFSNVQTENDYICNPENYDVNTRNFNVVKVFPLTQKELNKSDWNTVKDYSPTHIILLQSTERKLHDTKVDFVLKKQIPQWIYNSNTEDDTSKDKLAGTTFGLKYWVEGISEAYETICPENKKYFECSISIK